MVVFDVSEHLDNFLKKQSSFHDIAFQYYAGFIPFYLNYLSPLINFLAVILFTAKMANQTEFVAILSSGAGFKRILKPYLIGAFIIGFSSLLMNHFVIPKAQKIKIGFEDKWINNDTVLALKIFTKPLHRILFCIWPVMIIMWMRVIKCR